MRENIPINGDWRYSNEWRNEYASTQYDGFSTWDRIRLPHTNHELPFNCFDERDYQFVSGYTREITAPESWSGKRVYIRFEGVMVMATVYVNGSVAGTHSGGFTPFSVEIGGLLNLGEDNRITVKVDSREDPQVPPFGHVVDYLCYGGIYREVSLLVVPTEYISDLYIHAEKVLDATPTLIGEVSLDTTPPAPSTAKKTIRLLLIRDGSTVAETTQDVSESRRSSHTGPSDDFVVGDSGTRVTVRMSDLSGIELWGIDNPVLYTIRAELFTGNEITDSTESRFGFREARFEADGFYLNGNPIQLIGLNRHQSYPYVGYAMPERPQRTDADIIRRELGCNLVRTSHYPQSRHFLDRCDEVGLLVFEEIPGWQHVGDDEWKSRAMDDLRQMILRDRNRPSVVLWGVRINESQDDDEFYSATNRLARTLDPRRQTGGVRYLEKSRLLEDVYTMNDFIHDGGSRSR